MNSLEQMNADEWLQFFIMVNKMHYYPTRSQQRTFRIDYEDYFSRMHKYYTVPLRGLTRNEVARQAIGAMIRSLQDGRLRIEMDST